MNHLNVNHKIEDIFEEYAIPPDLRALHRSLCCQICGGLFDKAVMIQDCGHTFCSVCIRSFFQSTLTGVHRQAKQCPSCRHEILGDVDKALTMNRSVQEAVNCFKHLLVTMNEFKRSSLLLGGGESASTSLQGQVPLSDAGPVNEKLESSCQSNRTLTRNTATVAPNQGDRFNGEDTEDGIIEEEAADRPIDTKLPRLNFSTMKKKQLLDLCRKRGLPSNGTEEELKELHRRYVVKHNAELDNTNGPRTPSEVVAELIDEMRAQKEEQLRGAFNGTKQHTQLIKTLHASGGVSSGNAKFDETLQGNFKALIAQARARKEKEQEKGADNHIADANDDSNDGAGSNGIFESKGAKNVRPLLDFASPTSNVQELEIDKSKQNATANSNDIGDASLSSGTSKASSLHANGEKSATPTGLKVSCEDTTRNATTVSTNSNTTLKATLSHSIPSCGTVVSRNDKKRPSPTSLSSLSTRKRQPIDVDNISATDANSSLHRSLRNRNWACKVCTFSNLSMDTKCAMCRNPKG